MRSQPECVFHDTSEQLEWILVGMRRELGKPTTLLRLPALWSEFESSIETDLRRVDVLAFAERVLRIDRRHWHGLVLGVELITPSQTPDGKAVLRPNHAAIESALSKLFSAPAPGAPERGAVCPKADVALGAAAG